MDEPIALRPDEGPVEADRRELRELRAQGVEPDRAFFERHDVFDLD